VTVEQLKWIGQQHGVSEEGARGIVEKAMNGSTEQFAQLLANAAYHGLGIKRN
jgi:hypothetical protein